MKKILHVASREFAATVMTKGFIIGMLVIPVVIGIAAVVFPRMMNQAPPKVVGEIAVIDPAGQVIDGLRAYLKPEQFVARRAEAGREAEEAAPEAVRRTAASAPGGQAAIQRGLATAFGEVPQLDVVLLDRTTDLEQAKAPLKAAGGEAKSGQLLRLALVVVHPDAVRRIAGKERFGSYDLFVRSKLDDRLESDIRAGLRDGIIEARVRASGLSRREIEDLTRVDRPQSRTVTEEGERTTNEVLNMLMPAAFMVLLLMSSLTSGQLLLTTTVEEKSSRVVEVLLSALSPLELMTGKILGEMAVGLLVLAIYAGLGIVALFSFAMLGLLDPVLILFLLVFFVLAYFTIAAFMAAIGSAVNEMREAQSLMTPIMLLIMIPWILWLPISREPNSMLATVLSFVPPVGNFVMLLRMSSTAPPPIWQVALSIVVSAAGAVAAVWAAAKVFRIGVLMFGKPPSFGTLIRWVRMS
jgi:ABC-2 type transport system permease protein